jgi:ankyrin repeat protein
MWAAWRNNVEMVDFLLDKDANIYILNHQGDNALDIW